jgi:hypothetical protein
LDVDVPTTATVADSQRDIPTICGTVLGDLVYSFTLDQPRDVTLSVHSLDGYGVPQVSLEGEACARSADSEITCRQGEGAELFARALPAGTYFAVVGASGPSDVQVLLGTSAPSPVPADDTCNAPPDLPHNQAITIDLAGHTDAVFDGCLPGAVDAVYSLSLSEPSDVLLVERYSDQFGAINLFDFPCKGADRLACTVSDITPVRTGVHGLAPGNYAVVAESSLSSKITVTALTRHAAAPNLVAFADTCDTALNIPAQGGFFEGNTANTTADYAAGCDLPAQGPGGAKDQMLKLVLDKEQRVVLDMMGSGYSTLLAVNQGPDCPGTQVANACSVGVRGDRSYLDLTLPKGEYFVQIDGFAREEGQWFLDVYVVDP